jgi:MFS family permease
MENGRSCYNGTAEKPSTERDEGNQKMKREGRYELTLVSLFFLNWGFVFLDRLAISFLLPIIKPEMNITNAQVGEINLVTTGCFAVSAVIFGIASDRSGYRKRWLVPFVLLTAVFSGLGAFTHSFYELLLVRACVGIGEGPILPLMMSMLSHASSRNKFGRNSAIVNCGVGLIAITLGPIFITQLVGHTTWQMAFLISSLPTFVVAALIAKFAKEIKVLPDETMKQRGMGKGSLKELLSYRNVVVCCLICVGSMAGYWSLAIFAPLYLVNVAQVSVQQMGYISATMGVLYIVYSFVVPTASDYFGRKKVLILFYILCTLSPLCMFLFVGSKISIFMYMLFGGVPGAMSPIFMTLIPMETLPDRLRATANGLIMGFGEVIGGSIFPVIAGRIADVKGYPFMMLVAAIMLAVDILLGLLLIETNKSVLARRKPATPADRGPRQSEIASESCGAGRFE